MDLRIQFTLLIFFFFFFFTKCQRVNILSYVVLIQLPSIRAKGSFSGYHGDYISKWPYLNDMYLKDYFHFHWLYFFQWNFGVNRIIFDLEQSGTFWTFQLYWVSRTIIENYFWVVVAAFVDVAEIRGILSPLILSRDKTLLSSMDESAVTVPTWRF